MITASDLKRDAVGSIDIDLTDSTYRDSIGKSYRDVADNAIYDATGYVEGFLDRSLEVTSYIEYIEPEDWYYNTARGKYIHYSNQYPIKEVTTTGVTFDHNMFVSDERTKKVEYSAGYEILPSDIKRTIVNIALYLIRTSYDGLISWQSADKNIGGVQTTVSKDSMYIERELKKIEGYQRLQ